MLARIVRSADFERALGTPAIRRTPLFSLHHAPPAVEQLPGKLSTGEVSTEPRPVDGLLDQRLGGCVVPKRLARRAVTRHLVKRLVRAALAQRAPALPPGVWVVRLRGPIEPARFRSAASPALRERLGSELAVLLAPASS